MTPWYPLRFQPLLRRYLWGGRRLQSLLGKSLPAGDDYAESWEVVDRGRDQSVVSDGALAGWTLGQLVQEMGPELLGRHHPQNQFPLLFKFLDCCRDLSLQVHPNDDQAAGLDPPDRGKTEAWVILYADPGSWVYAGLAEAMDRQLLRERLAAGKMLDCIHRFHPAVGDCVFIPAGTVHALGAGLVVAEIQQASDTTFRLYDWDRLGADGRPRPLHVEQALEVIDYEAGPVMPLTPNRLDDPGVQRLIDCEQFVLERLWMDQPRAFSSDDRFHLLAVVEGTLSIPGDHGHTCLGRGDTALLPAALDSVALVPQGPTTILDVFLP